MSVTLNPLSCKIIDALDQEKSPVTSTDLERRVEHLRARINTLVYDGEFLNLFKIIKDEEELAGRFSGGGERAFKELTTKEKVEFLTQRLAGKLPEEIKAVLYRLDRPRARI